MFKSFGGCAALIKHFKIQRISSENQKRLLDWHILCNLRFRSYIGILGLNDYPEGEKIMTHMEKTAERRKNMRYIANRGSFAAMGLEAQTLGEIIDISLGGVCFKYTDRRNDIRESEAEQAGSILLTNMGIFVKSLPGKTVGDYPITGLPSISSMRIRKRHFQFVDLNIDQKLELEHHIKRFVSDTY